MVDDQVSHALLRWKCSRRAPPRELYVAWKIGNRRDYFHLISRETPKMSGPLEYEDPMSGVNRIGKQAGERQNAQSSTFRYSFEFINGSRSPAFSTLFSEIRSVIHLTRKSTRSIPRARQSS